MFSILTNRSLELLYSFATAFESLYTILFNMTIEDLIESSFNVTAPNFAIFDLTVIQVVFGAGLVTLIAFYLIRFLLDIIP